jgi:hypothetical protein
MHDLAVAHLKREGREITPQAIEMKIKELIDHHNKYVSEHGEPRIALGADGSVPPEALHQPIRVGGQQTRFIPNHRGDGSLGRNGWDRQTDGWDLIYDGEPLFVPAPGTNNPQANGGAKAAPTQAEVDQKLQNLGLGSNENARKLASTPEGWALLTSGAFSNLSAKEKDFALEAALKVGAKKVQTLIESDAFKSLDKQRTLRNSSQGGNVPAQELVLQRFSDPALAASVDKLLSDPKASGKFNSLSDTRKGLVIMFMSLYAGRKEEGYGKLDLLAGETLEGKRQLVLATLCDEVLLTDAFLDLVDQDPAKNTDWSKVRDAHEKIGDFVDEHFG